MIQRQRASSQRLDGTLGLWDATKTLGGVTVLQGVSLGVTRGQVVGLLGPNGAGKTTLLRGLLGLVALDSGEAWINGRTFHELDEPLRSVGVVIGNSMLDPRLSGYSNLHVYASAYGIAAERINDVLRLVGLTGAQDKPVKAYSLGMKKRLSIAVSLLTDPRFLVLDEPANGLDPAGLQWLKRLLGNLAHDQGKGILVSSHMLADLESILDKVVIVHAGRVCYSGCVEDLRKAGFTRVLVEDEAVFMASLHRAGMEARVASPGVLEVDGDVRSEVGRIALECSFPLQGLELQRESLASAYFRILDAQDEQVLVPKRTEMLT